MDKEKYYMSKDIVELVNYYNKNKTNKIEISKKKEEFYQKYNSYYNNPQIISKIKFYKNSINKNTKVNKIKKEEIKLKRLNKIIAIYYSEQTKYEKIEKISKVFENHNELWDNYYDLIIPLLGTKFISDLNKIYIFMKKNNELVEFIRYYSIMSKKELGYDYARFIIERYLENFDNYQLEDYLEEIGADLKLFDYCVDVVQEFNVELYNQYIKTKKEKDIIDIELKKNSLLDLVNVIKTGEYLDGKKYSVEEFFKRIPFKYSKNFYSNLINFTKENLPEHLEIISKFLLENNFYRKDINKELDYKEVMSNYFNINSNNIKTIDKLKVITYIQNNNLPFFYVVFIDVYSKYKKGIIELDEIKEYKKKKILIP